MRKLGLKSRLAAVIATVVAVLGAGILAFGVQKAMADPCRSAMHHHGLGGCGDKGGLIRELGF